MYKINWHHFDENNLNCGLSFFKQYIRIKL